MVKPDTAIVKNECDSLDYGESYEKLLEKFSTKPINENNIDSSLTKTDSTNITDSATKIEIANQLDTQKLVLPKTNIDSLLNPKLIWTILDTPTSYICGTYIVPDINYPSSIFESNETIRFIEIDKDQEKSQPTINEENNHPTMQNIQADKNLNKNKDIPNKKDKGNKIPTYAILNQNENKRKRRK